jgi:hypothetical protein
VIGSDLDLKIAGSQLMSRGSIFRFAGNSLRKHKVSFCNEINAYFRAARFAADAKHI